MGTTNFDSVEIGRLVQEHSAKVVVTSAQVLALNATPITLVAAPGTGKMLEFLGAVVHKTAGVAYAAVAAGDDLAIKYTDASGAQVNTSLECTGFVDQVTAQTRITRPIVTEYTPVANAALVLHMLNSEITTGNSPLYVTIRYRVWRDTTDSAVS